MLIVCKARGLLFRTATALAVATFLSVPLAAQSGAASVLSSPTYTLSPASISEGTGVPHSTTYSAVVSVGQPFPAGTLSSLNLEFDSGPFALDDAGSGTTPVLLGVADGVGSKDGGDRVIVLGVNLFRKGATIPVVHFGNLLATDVRVLSENALEVTTPPGTNAYGNPLGATPVTVETELGTTSLDDAFVYLPALLQNRRAHPGGMVELHYLGQPASSVQVARGMSGPGRQFGSVSGALELQPGLQILGPAAFAADGEARFLIPVAAANAGSVIEFQAISFSPTARAASFTNTLAVTIEP